MLRLYVLILILALLFAGCATLPPAKIEVVPEEAQIRPGDFHTASASPDGTTMNDEASDAVLKAENEAEEAYAAANEVYLQGDKDRAINLYRRALSLNPAHAGAQELLHRALNEKLEEVRLAQTEEAGSSVPEFEDEIGSASPETVSPINGNQLEEDTAKIAFQDALDQETAFLQETASLIETETPPERVPQAEVIEIVIGLGEDFHVILPTNPEKGEWKASVHDPDKMDLVGVLSAPPIPGSPETTGSVVFALRSKDVGEVTVAFQYGLGSHITEKIDYVFFIESNAGGGYAQGTREGGKFESETGSTSSWEHLSREYERISWKKREDEISALENALQAKIERLALKELELQRREEELSRRGDQISTREGDLAQRESLVEKKEWELVQKESEIAEASVRLNDQRERLELEEARLAYAGPSLEDRKTDPSLETAGGFSSTRFESSQDEVKREDLDRFNLGLDLLKEKMYNRALPELEGAIQASEDPRLKEGAALSSGLALSGQGRYDEAIALYRENLDEFPQGRLQGQTQLQMAKTFLEKGEYEAAIVEFKRAIISYPNEIEIQSEALLGLSDSYREIGEIELALRSSQELVDRFPHSPTAADAQFLIGDIYDRNLRVRNFHKAVGAYRRLIEFYSTSRWVERARKRIEHIEKNYL